MTIQKSALVVLNLRHFRITAKTIKLDIGQLGTEAKQGMPENIRRRDSQARRYDSRMVGQEDQAVDQQPATDS